MKLSGITASNKLIEILQNAARFEVYFQSAKFADERFDFGSEYLQFWANQINKNLDTELKGNLISAFLRDAEKGGEIMRCWIPHHGIKAFHENQLVEIAICFRCNQYRAQMSDEKFHGALPYEEESESKIILDKRFAGNRPLACQRFSRRATRNWNAVILTAHVAQAA